MNSPRVRIGSIAEQLRGVTYAKGDASSTPRKGFVALLRAGNITAAGLDFSDLVYVPESRVAPKQYVQRGDIIVAASSGSLDVVGKAAQATSDFLGGFGAFCKVVRPGGNVDARYLGHYFHTQEYRQKISLLAAGASINNLKNEHIDDLEIYLPPLDDQRRCADFLDRSDALRAKRRKTLALLDRLIQAIFRETFGDPTNNDRDWPLTTVGGFVDHFETGKSIAPADDGDTRSKFRILKISAVTSGTFDSSQSKPAPPNYSPPTSHLVRQGDLLFSRANTTELVGATAFVEKSPGNLLMPDKLWRFVWRSPAIVHPLWVRQLFRQQEFRSEISRRSSGSSGSMKNISQRKVLSIDCGLPPLSLQDKFAERVGEIERLKELQWASLAQLDALFSSLQHRAFRGEL